MRRLTVPVGQIIACAKGLRIRATSRVIIVIPGGFIRDPAGFSELISISDDSTPIAFETVPDRPDRIIAIYITLEAGVTIEINKNTEILIQSDQGSDVLFELV